MNYTESRQKDILLMVLAIQLSVFGVVLFFPLILVSGLITMNVIFNEAIRRLDEYADQ